MRGFNYKKSVQALNYLALKSGGSLNKMKAIKMIWLADRLHLRKYGRTITGDVYFALPYGPIPSTTRDILEDNSLVSDTELSYSNEYLSKFSKYDYSSKKAANEKVFSKTDLDAIENVFTKYNHLNEFELSDLSHLFPEWKKYSSALEKGIASRFEINPIDFFENYSDDSGLFSDSASDLNLSKEIFISENEIFAAL